MKNKWQVVKNVRLPFLNLSSSQPLIFCSIIIALLLTGCATTQETSQLRSNMSSVYNDLSQFKTDMETKLSAITKEQENLRRQLVSMATAVDSRDDKIKTILGKLDELDHQMQTYWNDMRTELAAMRSGKARQQGSSQQIPAALKQPDGAKYEGMYKDGFEAFQNGSYEDAIKKFSDFIATYPETPLVSNAYYWLGESYMNLKDYEKAIINFQQVIDRYPKSEKAPRALLSQAEAFSNVKDEKSSITILKRVVELYPKSEDAAIAERKLRGLGLR